MRVVKALAIIILILTFVGTAVLMNEINLHKSTDMPIEEQKEYNEKILINTFVLLISFVAGISVYIMGCSLERLLGNQEKQEGAI